GGETGVDMRQRGIVATIVVLVAMFAGGGTSGELAAPRATASPRPGFAAGVATAAAPGAVAAADPATPTFYFHGTAADQSTKAVGPPFTATLNKTAPTGTVAVQQTTTTGAANAHAPGNFLGNFWDSSHPSVVGTYDA